MARILVVDDDAPSRLLMARLFESRGHSVFPFESGPRALEAAQAQPPDIAISDVFMPGMDGFSVCQAWMVDDRLREIPFLFYTANYAGDEDRAFALSLGAAGYLVKPQHPEKLFAEVEGRLDGRIPVSAPRSPVPRDHFLSAHEQVVGRKLETKISEVDALDRTCKAMQRDFRLLFTANPQPMWIYDMESLRFLDVNDAAVEHYGYAPDEWRRMRITDIRPAEEVARVLEAVGESGPQRVSRGRAWTHLKKDGSRIQVEGSAHGMTYEGRAARVVTAIDITGRLQLQRAMEESEARYRSLFQNNRAVMLIIDPETRCIVDANPAAARFYGYGEAELRGMPLSRINRPGARGEDAWTAAPGQEEGPPLRLRQELAGGACRDVEVYSGDVRWNGRTLLYSIVHDVTERVRIERRELDHLRRIEEAMLGTITVVTRMVALRDPYLAGHHKRVAELSVAIAEELGLDAERRQGLLLGASVHDIGKISIPADILAKPGQLSAIEYEYVKNHAVSGYELLQGLSFPWPLARMALEHHERIDGSGYPRGLKGQQIMLEARILAVADTVEAMASHRPYRPAIGIEAALEEIERHAGVRYDAEVAEACLGLFREKGYGFS